MMDWNEHISDEALAAFIDGNATAEEAFWIQNNIGNDALLAETIDIVQDTTSLSSYDWGIHDGDYGFWELGLPPIVTTESLGITSVQDEFNFMEENVGLDDWSTAEDDWLTSDALDSDDLLGSDDYCDGDDMSDIFG